MDYTRETVVAVISNVDLIRAFLERTTAELFPTYYSLEDTSGFYLKEGNTLNNNGSHNTRVPKRDSLKENLMVILADVDQALASLDIGDRISVLYYYTIYKGKNSPRLENTAIEAVDKMVEFLNHGILVY